MNLEGEGALWRRQWGGGTVQCLIRVRVTIKAQHSHFSLDCLHVHSTQQRIQHCRSSMMFVELVGKGGGAMSAGARKRGGWGAFRTTSKLLVECFQTDK